MEGVPDLVQIICQGDRGSMHVHLAEREKMLSICMMGSNYESFMR